MKIGITQETDWDSIYKVLETAFLDEENKVIMNLAQELSNEITTPSIKSLIAETDNQVIGYVSYSPIFLKSDTSISGYILSPLPVPSSLKSHSLNNHNPIFTIF